MESRDYMSSLGSIEAESIRHDVKSRAFLVKMSSGAVGSTPAPPLAFEITHGTRLGSKRCPSFFRIGQKFPSASAAPPLHRQGQLKQPCT